jgi:hemolysin III
LSLPPIAPKPLLRGWSHAGAAVMALPAVVWLCVQSLGDRLLLISLAIYGVSLVGSYAVSATYHLGGWRGKARDLWHALDRACIFLLIAGTYTAIAANVLDGWTRVIILAVIWSLAVAGVSSSGVLTRWPRWVAATLYVAMGWVAIFVMPALLASLPPAAIGVLAAGGALYSVGAVIYARRWPNPLPRVFGYHEIFHLFVISGSLAFFVVIWRWVAPLANS